MKVITYPWDPNPYQSSLHAALNRLGIATEFLPERTSSHTVNLLLLPLETLLCRLRGARILHLHWTFRFSLPYAGRWPLVRRATHFWLRFWLLTVRASGLRLVWTAHNVLPHNRVFSDEERARRELVSACRAIIAHSPETLFELESLGCHLPGHVRILRPGPLESAGVVPAQGQARAAMGIPAKARVIGIVGRLARYKGVSELVDAFIRSHPCAADGSSRNQLAEDESGAVLLMAGECSDPDLESFLQGWAKKCPDIVLIARRLSEEQFVATLSSLDVAVLPFRAITSSGSALAALNAGTPVLVPAGPPLSDLPQDCLVRYEDLRSGLAWALSVDVEQLSALRERAVAWSRGWTWDDVAEQTAGLYERALSL